MDSNAVYIMRKDSVNGIDRIRDCHTTDGMTPCTDVALDIVFRAKRRIEERATVMTKD